MMCELFVKFYMWGQTSNCISHLFSFFILILSLSLFFPSQSKQLRNYLIYANILFFYILSTCIIFLDFHLLIAELKKNSIIWTCTSKQWYPTISTRSREGGKRKSKMYVVTKRKGKRLDDGDKLPHMMLVCSCVT